MPYIFENDRVRETSTTTGTLPFVLGGAVSAYRGWSLFGTVSTGGTLAPYLIQNRGTLTTEWEVGLGSWSGGTLTRSAVLSSSTGTLVSFSAGTKDVALVAPSALQPGIDPGQCQGRLTVASGTPITTTDQTAKSTVYWTPYNGNRISLYTGSYWKSYYFSELSINISGLNLTVTQPYDVFVKDVSGTLTLSIVAWSTATARATALSQIDGVDVLSTDTSGRYLGTFYPESSASVCDSEQKRFLWNRYNQVPRKCKVADSTTSWTYSTAAYRQFNGSANNYVGVVTGAASLLYLAVDALVENSSTNVAHLFGIGVDSNTVNSADTFSNVQNTVATTRVAGYARLTTYPTPGYHFYSPLEYTVAGTGTFYGSGNGGGTMMGWVMG